MSILFYGFAEVALLYRHLFLLYLAYDVFKCLRMQIYDNTLKNVTCDEPVPFLLMLL